MAERFSTSDPNYPTPLRNYLAAQLDEYDNTLSLDDAMGAVEEWLTEHISYDHPMFASAQGSRRAALKWLLSDEFTPEAS